MRGVYDGHRKIKLKGIKIVKDDGSESFTFPNRRSAAAFLGTSISNFSNLIHGKKRHKEWWIRCIY